MNFKAFSIRLLFVLLVFVVSFLACGNGDDDDRGGYWPPGDDDLSYDGDDDADDDTQTGDDDDDSDDDDTDDDVDDDGDNDVDDDADDDVDDDSIDPSEWAPNWGIEIQPDNFDFDTGCLHYETGDIGGCIQGYVETLDSMEEVYPINEVEMQVNEIRDGITQTIQNPIPQDELIQAIYAFAGGDWLDEKDTIKVTNVGEGEYDNFQLTILLFEGRTGQFLTYLFLPYGPGPHPVVVRMHGHGSDAWEVYHYDQEGLLIAGIGIMAINSRGLNSKEEEDEVSRLALTKGISFELLRIYEYFAAARYVKYRSNLGEQDILASIGAIGHSAGSGTIWLAHYVAPKPLKYIVSGIVIDNETTFYNERWDEGLSKWIWANDMLPLLYPYHPNMMWLDGQIILMHVELYGYPSGVGAVVDFFYNQIFNLRLK